jgi:small ligand-binding sensory domain FIST
VFADPFHLDGDTWLRNWNRAYPELPTVGGLAGGVWSTQRTQVYLNGEVYEEGGIALSIGGKVRIEAILSQGCTPIGDAWTITKTDRQFLVQIANRPAYSVLVDTFNALPKEEQAKTQGNLFVGLAGNEYRDEFKRGDFVVRSLLGADPENGLLAIGAMARAGQTLQFHRRDAASATEDLSWVLSRARERLANGRILGGCLCSCNGRGQRMFGRASHDAGLIQEQLGPLALTGFYCAGELGPVGGKNFLHAYTASLGLFVADPAE